MEKQEEKSASYAFGLIALGKFILRLPAEILEDELPRLKQTLTSVSQIFILLEKSILTKAQFQLGLE